MCLACCFTREVRGQNRPCTAYRVIIRLHNSQYAINMRLVAAGRLRGTKGLIVAGGTRSRVPPSFHAGVAITAPSSGAFLTGLATADWPSLRCGPDALILFGS